MSSVQDYIEDSIPSDHEDEDELESSGINDGEMDYDSEESSEDDFGIFDEESSEDEESAVKVNRSDKKLIETLFLNKIHIFAEFKFCGKI